MTGVDRKRCQNREDHLMEPRVHSSALFMIEFMPFENLDLVLAELWLYLIRPDPRLSELEGLYDRATRLDLLANGQSVMGTFFCAGLDPLIKQSHPLHEELVEIGGGDGQKSHSIEEWIGGILGFGYDPIVEFEPGEIPSEKTGRIRRVRGTRF